MSAARIQRVSFVLAVRDLPRSTSYWRDVLGWKLGFEDPGNWSFMFRDSVGVHLGECRDAMAPAETGDHSYFGYIVMDDVDAYHAEIGARGASCAPPADKPWGMREMVVHTIDGHRITFAQDLG
jgi:catechol 2,3-dioxygenase-like lactoylglutathione lyase family enzyme